MPAQVVFQGQIPEALGKFKDGFFHAVVTDPPYGLKFMGKKLDNVEYGFHREWAEEVIRVLKPGGHLLSFGGTRTYHRMASAVEDAGFEIRDMVSWLYGQGFPKSMNVGKAIDKAAGAERRVVGSKHVTRILDPETLKKDNYTVGVSAQGGEIPVTAPATPEAEQWEGWGTALKPAQEPIVLARKPFKGTVAGNVLEHGVGGLNIDGTRIDYQSESDQGRFPANVILDPEAAEQLDEQTGVLASRFFYTAKASKSERNAGLEHLPDKLFGQSSGSQGALKRGEEKYQEQDASVGLNRIKVVKNNHPTVKPIALMRYLIRLVTPPGGRILDPFAGSGTTLIAAHLEGFSAWGIEMEEEYVVLAKARIAHWKQQGDK